MLSLSFEEKKREKVRNSKKEVCIGENEGRKRWWCESVGVLSEVVVYYKECAERQRQIASPLINYCRVWRAALWNVFNCFIFLLHCDSRFHAYHHMHLLAKILPTSPLPLSTFGLLTHLAMHVCLFLLPLSLLQPLRLLNFNFYLCKWCLEKIKSNQNTKAVSVRSMMHSFPVMHRTNRNGVQKINPSKPLIWGPAVTYLINI